MQHNLTKFWHCGFYLDILNYRIKFVMEKKVVRKKWQLIFTENVLKVMSMDDWIIYCCNFLHRKFSGTWQPFCLTPLSKWRGVSGIYTPHLSSAVIVACISGVVTEGKQNEGYVMTTERCAYTCTFHKEEQNLIMVIILYNFLCMFLSYGEWFSKKNILF
jgi:hypothetical protein